MIQIANLYIDIDRTTSAERNRFASALHEAKIDILCCNSRSAETGNGYTFANTLADSLDMGYTYSNITLPDYTEHAGKKKVAGLSILTSKNSWMLNSGSLSFNIGCEEQRAQFGVIRHESNSILLVNTCLSGSKGKNLLFGMLSLRLLKEQFGAVLLCTHMAETIAAKELKAHAASNRLKIHKMPLGAALPNAPLVLTKKDSPPVSLKVNGARVLTAENERVGVNNAILCSITELELSEIKKEEGKKRYTLLSFRERGLGSRVGKWIFAL